MALVRKFAQSAPGQGVVLVDQDEVARMLGISSRTLEGMRSRRRGPPFVKISDRCVRYDVAAVQRYLTERTVQTESASL